MNIYLSKIQEISHQNKYTNWYISIITTALNRETVNDYTEKHHIVPRSFKMGGEKDKLNLVHLTAREHFIVHMLLVKMTINPRLKIKMARASVRMINNKYTNSKTFETARKLYSKNNPFKTKEFKDKSKQTNLKNRGCEFPSQNNDVREKIKQTNLENLGVENPMFSNEVKERLKQTNLELYGVEHPLQSLEIKEKMKQTNLNKFGYEYFLQSPEVREKIKQTNLEIYGCENVFQNEEIKQKSKETVLEKYGVEHISKTKEFKQSQSERLKMVWTTETCPHCNISGRGPKFKSNHFDKCRFKK